MCIPDQQHAFSQTYIVIMPFTLCVHHSSSFQCKPSTQFLFPTLQTTHTWGTLYKPFSFITAKCHCIHKHKLKATEDYLLLHTALATAQNMVLTIQINYINDRTDLLNKTVSIITTTRCTAFWVKHDLNVNKTYRYNRI